MKREQLKKLKAHQKRLAHIYEHGCVTQHSSSSTGVLLARRRCCCAQLIDTASLPSWVCARARERVLSYRAEDLEDPSPVSDAAGPVGAPSGAGQEATESDAQTAGAHGSGNTATAAAVTPRPRGTGGGGGGEKEAQEGGRRRQRPHSSLVSTGTRNPWWERVDTVDGILGTDTRQRVVDASVTYEELVTRCATVRKNAQSDLRHLNRSHSAWIEGQIKWEGVRHTKLYAAKRDSEALMPAQRAPEVTIGDNRIVYSSLFLPEDDERRKGHAHESSTSSRH